jgi:hypothetical protein
MLGHLLAILYNLAADEIPEAEDMSVQGETDSNEDDPQIPVRTLSDFSIYDRHTKALVLITELLEMETSAREFSASGIVGPWIETDDDESQWDGSLFGDESSANSEASSENRSPLRMSLSNIVDINVHYITETKDVDRFVGTFLYH